MAICCAVRLQRRCLSDAARLFAQQQRADYTAHRWGDNSHHYERSLHAKYVAYAEDALALLDAEYPKSTLGNMLDIGCGTGATMEAVSSMKLESFTAIDFSQAMVDTCTKRSAHSSLASRTTIQQMDGQNMLFADNTFSTCSAMFSILFFGDKSKGLQEMCRVVEKGGRGVVTGWTKNVEWITYSNKALVNVLGDRLSKCRSDTGEVPNFLAFSDHVVFKQMLLDAGWGTVKVTDLDIAFSFDNEEQLRHLWLDIAAAYPTLAFILETFPEEEREELKERVAGEFAKLVHEGLGTPQTYASLRGVATVGLAKK
eukprot:TRINITY_DN35335_c0_g1_i1.p1 TRINITY_DN35335_c0_g1~~TRINITY_DN35335_c0_g1_i1.p1  ORF type:complete len:313 (+),score=37.28 TRINITY_DN35335_c0_g1_i1:241-1179(+)